MEIIKLITPFDMRKMDIKYVDKKDRMIFIRQIIPDKLSTLYFHSSNHFRIFEMIGFRVQKFMGFAPSRKQDI